MSNLILRGAALNTGPEFHALDHIAPIAALMRMPLIVTEEKSHALACHYYPQIDVQFMPDLESQLSLIAERFDVLFECKYWSTYLKSLFQTLYGKEMRLVFCPHGQSDKGFQSPLLAPYAWQDAVLIYGQLLIEMLQDLKIWSSMTRYAIIGNYRLEFYRKHRLFYDRLIAQEIPLDRGKKTLLYAPTWSDADGASSFFEHGTSVIAQLPTDWNLILKIHPLLEQRDPARFYSIASMADKKSNVFLMHECPLVYPLLAVSDVYLGDASSVGYDFLYFQRPLYFFPANRPRRLHTCGRMIDPNRNIYTQITRSNSYAREQTSLYTFAFGKELPEELVLDRIKSLQGEQLPAHD